MQSIFPLSWCTEPLGFGAGDRAIRAPGALPPLDVAGLKKVKRKRTVTPDPDSPHATPKRQRPSTPIASDYISSTSRLPASIPVAAADPTPNTIAQQILPTATKLECDTNMATLQDVEMQDAPSYATNRQSRLRQALENQLNLQTLMKHNELRLIEQELAKCQVALEQLRRCELKPYPGSTGFDCAVSQGTGAAVVPPPGYTRASHAPTFGAVDGPYTRHYRRWLLPDPQFDSELFAHSPVEDVNMSSRSTRHAGARKSVPSTFATPLRDHMHGVPTYVAPAPRKDTSLPLVLRRSTDNKLVKLVCNNCNRGNMSSIQGFLNHCRIAHKVVYESHDAAALDCGRELDEQEIASLPAETQSMPVSKPVVRHAPSRTASIAVPLALSNTQSVHPFNKPGAAMPRSKLPPAAKPAPSMTAAQSVPIAAPAPFKPAAAAPHLSTLFARRNYGGDLNQAVLEARRKSDFVDDLISPASLTPGSPALVTPTSGRGMLSAIGNRTLGGKGQRPSYFGPPRMDGARSPNLSPHTDSNPGLVSDVEDDDNGSASEEESHHAPLSPPFDVRQDCGSNIELDVAVEHGMNERGVVIRRNSMLGGEDRTAGGPSATFGTNRH